MKRNSGRAVGRGVKGVTRLVAVGLPLIFLGAALWFGWWIWSDRLASDRVSGLVLSVQVNRSDDSVSYTPTFLYTAPWGSGQATPYYGSGFYNYRVGQIVPIFVNPERPDRARVDNDIEFYWLPGGVIAFSMVILLGGLAATRSKPERHGKPQTARAALARYRMPKTRPARTARPAHEPAPAEQEPAPDPAPGRAPSDPVDRRRSPHTLPRRDGPTVRRE